MIFYADDDFDDLEIFQTILNDLGQPLVSFDSGDGILFGLDNPPPDASLIFLDINMPTKSGLDVLDAIRTSEKTKDVPVVMLSTSDSEFYVNESRRRGANFYIPKAPDYQALAQSIKYALSIDWNTFWPSDHNFVYKR